MTGPLFPGNYSTVWIRGRFITMDGQPVRGKLSLFPTVTGGALVNRSAKLIMSSAVFSADTGNDGYVAVQVPATNDPDLTPVNFTYSVTTPIGQMFSIVVPYDTTPLNSVGDPLHGQPVIELIDVVPVGSSGGVGQLLRGIGVQSMVDNGAGGLLITYTDGSTTTVAMPGTVAGPPGPAGPTGPTGPTGATGPTGGGATKLVDLTDVTTTGAAVGKPLVVAQVDGSGNMTGAKVGDSLQRVASVVIAPSDAPNIAKLSSDVVLTGTGDQTAINAAIAGLPARGGKLLIRAGQVNLSDSIVVDRSFVDIEGETHPMWGAYVSGTPYGVNTGAEGSGGTKIKAAAAGFDLITIANAVSDNAYESRHRAIRFAKLYLFGSAYNGTGVDLTSAIHDAVTVEDCFFHRLNWGIRSNGDAFYATNNDIQDCNNGIYNNGPNGRITQNLLWDLSAQGIQVFSSESTVVSGNIVGNIGLDGIYAAGAAGITGNLVAYCKRYGIIGGTGAQITSNVLRANSLSVNQIPITAGLPQTPATGVTVTGNAISTVVTMTSPAIGVCGTKHVVVANSIAGTWASGVAPAVAIVAGSGSNLISSNSGAPTTASGSASVADGGTIPHGLGWRPTGAQLTGSVASEIVTCTALTAAAITAAIKTGAGAAGTTQKLYWSASVVDPTPASPVDLTTSGAGVIGWWRADALTLANGAAITSLPDFSSSGYAMLATGTGITCVTGAQNSLRAARFPGTSGNFLKCTQMPNTAQPVTMFVACKQAANGASTQSPVGGGEVVYITSAQRPGLFAGSGQTGAVYTPTAAHIIEGVFNGAASSISVNGASATTISPGAGALGLSLSLGSNQGNTAEWFNGDIYEVLVVAGALNSTDRTAIRTYLGTKWGISTI